MLKDKKTDIMHHYFFSCKANILHRLAWRSGILFSEEKES